MHCARWSSISNLMPEFIPNLMENSPQTANSLCGLRFRYYCNHREYTQTPDNIISEISNLFYDK